MKCVIIYVSDDVELATQIATELSDRGIDSSLLDAHEIDTDDILKKFEELQSAVAVLSKNSIDDDSFDTVIAYADNADLDLYSVCTGEPKLSSNLSYFLQWSQWLDLTLDTNPETYNFLTLTILSRKPLDHRQHPINRRQLKRQITFAVVVLAFLVSVVGGVILWKLATLSQQAEKQENEKRMALLRPPADLSLSFSPRSGNPWIADPRVTIGLANYARQRRGVELALYRPTEVVGLDWEKTGEFIGEPVSSTGYQWAEIPVGLKPKNGMLCIIYGRDLGNGLLRRQYATFVLDTKDDSILLKLDRFGLVAEDIANCDDLLVGKIGREPLMSRAWHQTLLNLHDSRPYLAPYGIKNTPTNGLAFDTLVLGAGTQIPPDTTIYSFYRENDSTPWTALSQINLAKSYAILEGLRPNQLLVCADTRMSDIDLHIGVSHRFIKHGDTYQTVKRSPPILTKSKSPCLVNFGDGNRFPVTTEIDWHRFILPESSRWRYLGSEPVGFQLGKVYIGQQWFAAVDAANSTLSGFVRTDTLDKFENLLNGPMQPVLRAVFSNTTNQNAIYLIGDNDRRGLALSRDPVSNTVNKIFYAVRPSIKAYHHNREIFNHKSWSERISSLLGNGKYTKQFGENQDKNEFALRLWPTSITPCGGLNFSYNLYLDTLEGNDGCIPHAGALFHRQYDNVNFLAWATSINEQSMKK